MTDFLPVATDSPPPLSPDAAVSNAVAALADTIVDSMADPTNLRVGVVTSVADPTAAGRVQIDIGGVTWCNRSSDVSLAVGHRVVALQQGSVMVVVGRLGGGEAHPIGALLAYAGSTAPLGWLMCDGAAVSRTTYAALFAVIGTTYGAGNGSTTFNVPDLRNRVPVGSGSTYTRGQAGGAATVTLSEAQIPSHDHTFTGSTYADTGHSHSGSTAYDSGHSHSYTSVGSGSAGAGSGGNGATAGFGTTGSGGSHSHSLSISTGGSHSHSFSGGTSASGSGGAHENMPPFVAMPTLIRAL